MRLITIALFMLLFTMTATAVPLPITISDPYGDPNDVRGSLADFDIHYVQFTIIEAGMIEAVIRTNYHGGDNLLGDWTMVIGSEHDHHTVTLEPGDLLFDVDGVYTYGVPLTAHDGLTAGALYQVMNDQPFTRTARSVLGLESAHDGSYNPDEPVWINASIDPSASHAQEIGGNLDFESIRFGSTDEIQITMRFVPTVQFLLDLAHTGAHPGLSVHFASATCANDILDGSFWYPVPEPASMVLMGGGLLALGLFGRRFRRG